MVSYYFLPCSILKRASTFCTFASMESNFAPEAISSCISSLLISIRFRALSGIDMNVSDTIEEIDGVGRIEVAGTNKKCIDDAMRMIKSIVAVPEIGETYMGKVRSVMPYGVFVEFLPGKDGLLHISEIDWKRLETIEESGLKEGDEIEVKLLDIDPKTGKFKLSHKVLLPKPEGMGDAQPKREHRQPKQHK